MSAAGHGGQADVGAPSVVGVFGGSFDPPHVGHVLLASWALSAGGLDRLLVVPTLAHPFGKQSAPFEHRLAMARRAFAVLDPSKVEVSDIEATLGRPSYMVRTLEALLLVRPTASHRLLVGADVLSSFDRWHEHERVEALAPLLVGGRAGHVRSARGRSVAPHVPSFPEVSSTEVRAMLGRGEDCRSLVPRDVLSYLSAEGLYRAPSGDSA